jgi:hypothetical protein
MELWIGSTRARCLRHVSFTFTQTPRSSPNHQGILCQLTHFLPWSGHRIAVLTKALCPCVARSFGPGMNFQSQSTGCLIPWGHPTGWRDPSSSEEGASGHFSWMELSQMGPQIVINKIPEGHWSRN